MGTTPSWKNEEPTIATLQAATRSTPRAPTSRPTREFTQGKSRTPASGQSVTINLPGLTSWPGIIGSTPVQSRSNAKCASAVLHGVTTLPCTWKDIYQSTWRTEWRMYETSQRKSTALRWKSLNVIKRQNVTIAEEQDAFSLSGMWCNMNQSKFTDENLCYAPEISPLTLPKSFNTYLHRNRNLKDHCLMRKDEQTSPGSISSQEWEVKMKDTNELTMIPLQWCYRSIDHNLSTKILWILPGSAAASAISMQSHISLVRR